MLAVGAMSVRLNFSFCSSCALGLPPITAGPINPPLCPLLEGVAAARLYGRRGRKWPAADIWLHTLPVPK
jgi:hypothetical protein